MRQLYRKIHPGLKGFGIRYTWPTMKENAHNFCVKMWYPSGSPMSQNFMPMF